MGAFIQKPKSANDYENLYYDKKTSEYGHYVPEVTGKRHGRDGSQAAITEMRWVEDNRQFGAPSAEQAPPSDESADIVPEIQLSRRAAEANAGTAAYEDVLLNRQGDAAIRNDRSPEQAFKNTYQNNLINELKAKDPSTIASKMAEIEIADKQKSLMQDSFDLDLRSNPLTQGRQEGSNLTFS